MMLAKPLSQWPHAAGERHNPTQDQGSSEGEPKLGSATSFCAAGSSFEESPIFQVPHIHEVAIPRQCRRTRRA
jgi:hypothetical protein